MVCSRPLTAAKLEGQTHGSAAAETQPLGGKRENYAEGFREVQMVSKQGMSIPEFGSKQDGIVYITRPGVYAVVKNTDKKIAVIETGNGYFLPGGGIEIGESDVDALKREIVEEIGYQALIHFEIGEAIEYIDADREAKHYQIHSKFYKVQLGSKIVEGVEKDHRLVWLWQEDAIKLLKRQGQVWAVQSMIKE